MINLIIINVIEFQNIGESGTKWYVFKSLLSRFGSIGDQMSAKDSSKFEVKVVFCEPIPAYHLEALKLLIKKAALRKLKQMMLEAQEEAA